MSTAATWSFIVGAVFLLLAVLVPALDEADSFGEGYENLFVVIKLALLLGTGFVLLPIGLGGLIVELTDGCRSVPRVRASGQSSQERLIQLQQLHRDGLITDQEYQDQRSKVLSAL